MHLESSAYQVVHDYPGGAAAVAVLTGINAHTLQHKVDPHDPRYKLSLEEAARVSECTRDMRILHAFAQRLRHMVVPLPDPQGDEGSVSDRIISITRELGEYFAAVAAAIEDRRVTPIELRRIEREEGELVEAVAELSALLKRLAVRVPAPAEAR